MEDIDVDLLGHGPFHLPLFAKCTGVDPGHEQGWLVLQFETEKGQEVLVPLSAEAARSLSTLLKPEALQKLRKLRQEGKI